jgi:hypothetical protein
MRSGKARKGVEMLRHGMRIGPLDNRLSFWGANLAYALFRLSAPQADASATNPHTCISSASMTLSSSFLTVKGEAKVGTGQQYRFGILTQNH